MVDKSQLKLRVVLLRVVLLPTKHFQLFLEVFVVEIIMRFLKPDSLQNAHLWSEGRPCVRKRERQVIRTPLEMVRGL